MKTLHRELQEGFSHYIVPATAWAALLAFFAIAGALSLKYPDTDDAKPAFVSETVGATAALASLPRTPDAAQPRDATQPRDASERDEATVAQEALDPVGVGINPVSR